MVNWGNMINLFTVVSTKGKSGIMQDSCVSNIWALWTLEVDIGIVFMSWNWSLKRNIHWHNYFIHRMQIQQACFDSRDPIGESEIIRLPELRKAVEADRKKWGMKFWAEGQECRIPFKTDLGLTIRCGPIDGLQVKMEKQREKSWPSAEGPERGVKQSSYSSTKNGEDIIAVVALGRILSLVNICESNHRCSRHVWQWPIVVWN